MHSEQIRQRFLDFFAKRGHAIIPSAPLVPENDPTTLFTGSGMQPMVPYLLGEEHPLGTRIVDSQKCFRTVDIDEVGDNRHTTFFEMLGNWSLGDYFKKEQLPWLFEFLIDEIGLDPERLYVTAFIGDEKYGFPKDIVTANLWKDLFANKGIEAKDVEIGSEQNGYEKGMQGGRIFYYDATKNWWSRAGSPENMPVGEPGGPDSEVFYDFGTEHNPEYGKECHPNCDCGRFLEIGNSVFMEYLKKSENSFVPLPQQNVDFGGGLERIAMAVNNNPDMFMVNHVSIVEYLEKMSGKKYGENESETKAFRIIADHIKAATFLISDGVLPSNTDQGYFVRRLIRRSVRYSDKLGIKETLLAAVVEYISYMYKDFYPEVLEKMDYIMGIISEEERRFRKTLGEGMRQFLKLTSNISTITGVSIENVKTINGISLDKVKEINGIKLRKNLSGKDAFVLFSSFGFPLELLEEMVAELGIHIDKRGFEIELEKHQRLSRVGAEQKFKGGLASHGEEEVKYHTATHLLHQALHDVLGSEVEQKGSNITPERLRFDFSFPRKVEQDELARVEQIVNDKIALDLPVKKEVLPKDEAERTGAFHFFNQKYPDEVTVYYVGENLANAYSKEFCGGPHVGKTSELARVGDPEHQSKDGKSSDRGPFKIIKEESAAAGIRRIKAVLE